MPAALAKVQKKIRKKKGSLTALSGRDTKGVNSAALREEKLRHQAKLRHAEREAEMVRVGYFKVAVKGVTAPVTEQEVREMIKKWIYRDDHELERLRKERRPGRPAHSRLLLLEQRIDRELDEFRSGFLVPDLTEWKNVQALQRWDGTMGSLSQVKRIRITRDPIVREVDMGLS